MTSPVSCRSRWFVTVYITELLFGGGGGQMTTSNLTSEMENHFYPASPQQKWKSSKKNFLWSNRDNHSATSRVQYIFLIRFETCLGLDVHMSISYLDACSITQLCGRSYNHQEDLLGILTWNQWPNVYCRINTYAEIIVLWKIGSMSDVRKKICHPVKDSLIFPKDLKHMKVIDFPYNSTNDHSYCFGK